MGNITSSNQNNSNTNSNTNGEVGEIGEIIDYIATHYILTMNFQSLKSLYKQEYCNNLIVLTSDIINSKFNEKEITYLAQRVKEGVLVNEVNKERFTYFHANELEPPNSIKKKRICAGIAKFYVKIAHLFAAIIMTINPVYSYKDEIGNVIKKTLAEKDQIPKNVNRTVNKTGICNNRINSLKKGADYENKTDESNLIVHPSVCSINTSTITGNVKTLEEEPGIPELYDLYFDKYDYEKDEFNGMTEETQKIYLNDLRKFYNTFTGETNMPDNIRKFSDIKLRDYKKQPGCQSGLFDKMYKSPIKNELFTNYAQNLQLMVQNANKKQEKLLDIINELFTYEMDKKTNQKIIRVNPNLTEISLQKVIEKTRNIIIDLYLTCEEDYVKGIKLYEAIVENQIRITTQAQLKSLENSARELSI